MSEAAQNDISLEPDFVDLTADIVSAYVSNNTVASGDLPALIATVHAALSSTVQEASEPVVEELKPAVPIKKSVTNDHIICLEDGKKFKSLKRHLRTHYDLTRKSIEQSGTCRRTIRWSRRVMRLPDPSLRERWAWARRAHGRQESPVPKLEDPNGFNRCRHRVRWRCPAKLEFHAATASDPWGCRSSPFGKRRVQLISFASQPKAQVAVFLRGPRFRPGNVSLERMGRSR